MKHFKVFFRVGLLFFVIMGGGMTTAHMTNIPAASPQIQYFGRWDVRDGVYRCGFGATYIKANFTGTALKADLKNRGDSWWRVSIDGSDFRRFRPQGRDTVLAENLQPGEHKVLLVRSTEGEAGITEFRGFAVDEGAHLTAPDPRKERRLEFVGDSITAGALNDGKWVRDYHEVEDNDMSYGPQLARMLDADYSVIAKSGQGVVHNYAEKWPGHGVHAADSYAWTFFYNTFGAKNLEWDTSRFPVDGILISIGTNDFTDANRKPTAEEFKEGYRKLVSVVRSRNPGKEIICIAPFSIAIGPYAEEWTGQVVEEMRAAGDEKVHFISVTEGGCHMLLPEDFVDGSTHPTKDGSRKAAIYLKEKVAHILGW